MFRKTKYIIVILLSITIICSGFIKVSSELPDFIKDRSSFKVTYNKNPFDLQITFGDYILYINKKAFDNIKSKIAKLL